MSLLRFAWRSIWRNRRRTLISVSAVALGMSLAVFLLALSDGVYAQMIDDAVRINGGHFTLENAAYRDAPAIELVVDDTDQVRERLQGLPGVKSTKVLVLGQGVAKTGTATTSTAIIGIEPSLEAQSSPLATHLVAGEYLADGDRRKVVIGEAMAERLKLEVGKKLVVASTDVNGDLTEELLRVKGIFAIGSGDLDGHVVQVPVAFARQFYGLGPQQATQVGAVLERPELRAQVMRRVEEAAIPEGTVLLPWERVLPELANYIRLDRDSNRVFQGIIIFLCMFTIFNTILMSVLERAREFAMMLALGTSPRRLRAQVMLESVLLALLGIAAGLVVGGSAAGYFQIYGIDMRAIMGEDFDVSGFAVDTTVRAKLSVELIVALSASILVATLAMSLYAVRGLKRIDLATVLR